MEYLPGQNGPLDVQITDADYALDDWHTMREKLQSDIAFLNDRLERSAKQNSPNTFVIQNYRKMLEVRVSVLASLTQQELKPARAS